MTRGASRKTVEAPLAMEATKPDAAHPGTHRFGAIQRTRGAGCNWTADSQAIGSRLPLDELEAAPERTQRAVPVVDFRG